MERDSGKLRDTVREAVGEKEWQSGGRGEEAETVGRKFQTGGNIEVKMFPCGSDLNTFSE